MTTPRNVLLVKGFWLSAVLVLAAVVAGAQEGFDEQSDLDERMLQESERMLQESDWQSEGDISTKVGTFTCDSKTCRGNFSAVVRYLVAIESGTESIELHGAVADAFRAAGGCGGGAAGSWTGEAVRIVGNNKEGLLNKLHIGMALDSFMTFRMAPEGSNDCKLAWLRLWS